jgi:RHS repeat-associated protein
MSLFQYDRFGHLLEETDNQGNVRADYIYLDGRPIAEYSAGKLYFLHDDRLGTPQVATDTTQAPAWIGDYQPFGALTASSQTALLGQDLRLPGQENDIETGLYHNGFRDYNPAFGRYIESDPVGLGGGMNTYLYVGGNPVTQVDPPGLWQVTISGGYGIGGLLTFGHNSGQWNFGAYLGLGSGAAGSFDPNDSGCHGTVFGVRGEGELGFGPNITASSFLGNYADSYEPDRSGELSIGIPGTPLSFAPLNTENGQLLPPPLKPTIGGGASTFIGGGGTIYFPTTP